MLAAVAVALWSLRLPETLPPERRRSVSPGALLDVFKVVVTAHETLAFGLAVTALFGIMTAFVGGAEIIFKDVYGQEALFPVLFGLIACMLGVGNVVSGRLVMRLGLSRLVRFGACYVVVAAVGFTVMVLATDGRPPLWAFVVGLALFLPERCRSCRAATPRRWHRCPMWPAWRRPSSARCPPAAAPSWARWSTTRSTGP